MMKSYAFGAFVLMTLSSCAQMPMGPTVPVMPGPNTSFVSFQNDQATCRQFADQAVVDQAQGANLRALGTAALTTAFGAGLGGAVGGGRGAGIGAASGAIGGAGLGAVGSSNAQRLIQAQYDNAFAACMFSLGNTMPGMKPMMTQPQGAAPATAQMTGWLWRKNLGDPLADQPSRLLCRNGPVAAATAGKEVALLSLKQMHLWQLMEQPW